MYPNVSNDLHPHYLSRNNARFDVFLEKKIAHKHAIDKKIINFASKTQKTMMMYKRLFTLLSIIFGSLLTTTAQEDLWFRHLDSKDYDIRTFYRTNDGVMWMGTSSGLVSLPQLMSRTPNAYHRNHAELNTAIDQISGDSLGWLCMKTQNRDVILYNPRQDAYVFDTTTQLEQQGIHVTKDFTIFYDEQGGRWIWKDDKMYVAGHVLSFDGEQVHGVCAQPTQTAVLTEKALYYISATNGKTIRRVPLPEDIQSYAQTYAVNDIEWWLRHGKTLHMYDYPANQWTTAITTPSEISGFQIDNEGRRWVSTQNDGIFIYDSRGQLLWHLQHEAWDSNSLQSNRINALSFDRENNAMWIAYWKGGLTVCSTHGQAGQLNRLAYLTAQKASTDILTFGLSTDGKQVYFGTEDQGVFAGEEPIIRSASTTALYSDRQGTLWMGLYGKGLVRRTPDGRQDIFFAGRSPYAIVESGQCLYVALLGEGIWRLDPKTGEQVDTRIRQKYVLDLQHKDQHLYAATTEGFFEMTANQRWQKICDGKFRSFCIDHAGYFWLLGDVGYEGLTLLDPQKRPVPVLAGLEHAALKSIAVDKDDQVWITTSQELLMLRHAETGSDQLEKYVFNINPDGRYLYYNYHAILIDGSEHLWLGTTTGYQCLSIPQLMSQTKRKQPSTPILVSAISINDQICSPGQIIGGRVLLSEDVIYTRKLDLKYNENNIVVECASSYNKGFGSYTYYYQIKGFSDDWRQMKDQTIVLSNLPPGNYQLMVKTLSSVESLLLTIQIASPWWQTWWAYTFYLLLAGTLIYGIIRYFNNKRAYQMKLRELELQQEQQAQVNEMKLRFFTNISHDLRTPLSLIIGPLEELIKQVRDPRKHDSLQMIHRNAQHLLSLVNQILDFRRLEFGREKLVLSRGDVVSLVEDVCMSFRLKGEKENIRLTFLPAVKQVETEFDRDKTTKIMMNLLSNAFKFTDAGGSIRVELSLADEHIVISVTDTGIGIPDRDKAHIFDRFFQSDTGNRTSIGSGIGLHIVREYVRLQGGDITISNPKEGHGSVFRFTIPLRQETATSEEQVSDTGLEPNQTAYPPDSASDSATSLLLVDDNQDLLVYMSQALADNHEILTATNGLEALERLKAHDIDIIVSDVMMPKMDGLELCQRIKNDINTSHIPVILLTAKAMTSDELQGLEAGADDYVTKPFSMDILRRRIQNLVERSQNRYQRFAKEVDIEPSEITITSLDEQFIARAISIVEAHISESEFNVDQLSQEIGLHRSQVYKKIQHITGKTPVIFIRLLRLKRGKQLLNQSGLYISEIAYKVGLSPRNFSKYFKEEFGITPKEYLDKREDIIS